MCQTRQCRNGPNSANVQLSIVIAKWKIYRRTGIYLGTLLWVDDVNVAQSTETTHVGLRSNLGGLR